MQAQLDQVRLGRGAFEGAPASSTDSDDEFFFSDESDDEPSDCDSPVNDAATSSGGFSFGLCGDVSMVEEAEDDSFFEESSFARHVGGIDGIKQEVVGHVYDLADSDMDDSDGLSLRCVLATGGIEYLLTYRWRRLGTIIQELLQWLCHGRRRRRVQFLDLLGGSFIFFD